MSRKFIGRYQEFYPDGANRAYVENLPKLADQISDMPIEHKEEIISYLNGGEIGLACSAFSHDVFTGEQLKIREQTRHDGIYEWGEDLAYYVERYNVRLPQDFLDHILEQSGAAT